MQLATPQARIYSQMRQAHVNTLVQISQRAPTKSSVLSVISASARRAKSSSATMELKEIEASGGSHEAEEEEVPLNPKPIHKTVTTKVPEAEIRLYRLGKGPIEVFKTSLGGWDQDQLEVVDILDKYGLKTLFAFSPESGRGVPIRFHPRNGRSLITYSDGSVIHVDGEPKDSLIKPITKVIFGIAVLTLLLTLFLRETPEWIKKPNFLSGTTFPPWVLVCMVIVFTRLRKRTRNILKKYGW